MIHSITSSLSYVADVADVAEHTYLFILTSIKTNPDWVKIANARTSARDLSIYIEWETNCHQILRVAPSQPKH
jgi:hypothetical protein